MIDYARALGELRGEMKARFIAVESDVHEIKTDVKTLVARDHQQRGGWRAITVLGGIAASLGAGSAWLLDFFRS